MADKVLRVQDYEWHVIVNPNACEKRCFNFWDTIALQLDQANISYVLHKSQGSKMGIQTAKGLCEAGKRHLMVIGGDGTINEVVNGIMLSGVDPKEVFLAVVPLGRGNDWARTHSYPVHKQGNIEVFLKGDFMCHDVGKVQTLQQDKTKSERFFINIVGFGFDAEVIYDATYKKPHFMGVSVYILSLIRTLFRYKSIPVQVQSKEVTLSDKSFLMVVAICQYNGGGMRQAPMAVPNDGKMDVVFIPEVSKFRVLTMIKSLFKGKHIEKMKDVIKVHQTAELTITSETPFRAEVEGELVELGNYRVTVLPQALNMLTNL